MIQYKEAKNRMDHFYISVIDYFEDFIYLFERERVRVKGGRSRERACERREE